MKTVKGTHAPRTQPEHAFSRADLIITVFVVVLLLLVISPGLADTRYRSQRAGCIDNRRQIGQAVQLWAADHENINSWLVPRSNGGTQQPGKTGNAFREFLFLSNQLVTPKILVCPADQSRFLNSAQDWGASPNSGYAHPNHQNSATSYIVNLHSFFDTPNSLLSSDRNLQGAGQASCGISGVNNASIFLVRGYDTPPVWTSGLHPFGGNLLLNDGRVLETSNSGLQSYLGSL